VIVNEPERLRGMRVLVVEDGPTLTHGGMTFGAGVIAAQTFGALEIVDPRPYAAGSISDTYSAYPHIGPVLPAMGYSAEQIRDLEETINASGCDLVLFATPIQLTRIVSINKPAIRVRYEYEDNGSPALQDVLLDELKGRGLI
jgi:predicted GTPase